MSASKRITVTEIIDAVDNDEWLLSEDELEDDEFEDHSVLLPTSDYLQKAQNDIESDTDDTVPPTVSSPPHQVSNPQPTQINTQNLPSTSLNEGMPNQLSQRDNQILDLRTTSCNEAMDTQPPESNPIPSTPLSSSSQPSLPIPGPILPDDLTLESALDYFVYIFGEDTFKNIAQQTNLYALQCNQEWHETSTEEIKAFLGMILAMGIHKVPSVSDYWSQHALLGVPGITRNMLRNRFMQILQNLHLNDNSKMPQPGYSDFDKLHKVRPLLETIRMNSQKAYSPHQEVSVDEAMVLF